MQSWIFTIITPVFSVKWPSEIILICWFSAQEKCLINVKTVLSNSWSVWHCNGYNNANMFGIGGINYLDVIALTVDYCCCRESTGLAIANTHTTHCCEQVWHAATIQYGIPELPMEDQYRWSQGRRRVSEACCKLLEQMLTKCF